MDDSKYFNSRQAANVLQLSTVHTRCILAPPDKKEQTPNGFFAYYLKERVLKLKEIRDANPSKYLPKKKRKQQDKDWVEYNGKGVQTWCTECGLPFVSRDKETVCGYCKTGYPRPPEDAILRPRRRRSRDCECGMPMFVGQMRCSWCSGARKTNDTIDYREYYPGVII